MRGAAFSTSLPSPSISIFPFLSKRRPCAATRQSWLRRNRAPSEAAGYARPALAGGGGARKASPKATPGRARPGLDAASLDTQRGGRDPLPPLAGDRAPVAVPARAPPECIHGRGFRAPRLWFVRRTSAASAR